MLGGVAAPRPPPHPAPTYVQVHPSINVYIYIYIERERDRERDKISLSLSLALSLSLYIYIYIDIYTKIRKSFKIQGIPSTYKAHAGYGFLVVDLEHGASSCESTALHMMQAVAAVL